MTKADDSSPKKDTDIEAKLCGVIMPIAEIDGRSVEHWKDVKSIISEAASLAGYEARLVSDDTDSGLIHKRIVENLYKNTVIVYDVSAKNPNVMFELGMRLTFDKPTVIVKDDDTGYSFDTSPIHHLTYPRTLRYAVIQSFIAQLAEKITHSVKSGDKNTFLRSFGSFKVPEMPTESVPGLEYFGDKLASLEQSIRSYSLARNIESHMMGSSLGAMKPLKPVLYQQGNSVSFSPMPFAAASKLDKIAQGYDFIKTIEVHRRGEGKITFTFNTTTDQLLIDRFVEHIEAEIYKINQNQNTVFD